MFIWCLCVLPRNSYFSANNFTKINKDYRIWICWLWTALNDHVSAVLQVAPRELRGNPIIQTCKLPISKLMITPSCVDHSNNSFVPSIPSWWISWSRIRCSELSSNFPNAPKDLDAVQTRINMIWLWWCHWIHSSSCEHLPWLQSLSE